jgi:hypothetical protein
VSAASGAETDGARSPEADERPISAQNVRRVRTGTGANCSSVGSVVDTLFVTATVGAAVFAAVVAALRSEPVRVVRPPSPAGDDRTKEAEPSGGAERGA